MNGTGRQVLITVQGVITRLFDAKGINAPKTL